MFAKTGCVTNFQMCLSNIKRTHAHRAVAAAVLVVRHDISLTPETAKMINFNICRTFDFCRPSNNDNLEVQTLFFLLL